MDNPKNHTSERIVPVLLDLWQVPWPRSKQSINEPRAAGGKRASKQILLPVSPKSSVSCSGFCWEVHVANPSLQSPPVKLLPIPYKSTDNLILTYPLHFKQQRRCSQSFCGIVCFSWEGRGLEALPKPWEAGFWTLALSTLYAAGAAIVPGPQS